MQIILAPLNSHGGSMILVQLELKIFAFGLIGSGLAAWAQIQDVKGNFGIIIGVYDPSIFSCKCATL